MAYIKKQVAQLADKDGNPMIGNVQSNISSTTWLHSSAGPAIFAVLWEHGLLRTSS